MSKEETYQYQVLQKDGDFETRLIAPCVLANITLQASDYASVNNLAFDVLYNYISGNNLGDGGQNQKVAMTSPVSLEIPSMRLVQSVAQTTEQNSGYGVGGYGEDQSNNDKNQQQTYTCSFLLPSKYTFETAPKPLDERIKLVEQLEKKVAVYSFKGRGSQKEIEENKPKLDQMIVKHNLQVKSPLSVNRFNAPWVPFQISEIWYEID
jgi:hypothetical protein